MTYELIQDLCESRVFRTRQATERYSATEAVNFFYAYVLATAALGAESGTQGWAADYFSKTAAFGNFDHFRASGTDLYVLAFMVREHSGSNLMGQRLVTLFRRMAQGQATVLDLQSYLMRLERGLGVRNSRLKNIRRLLSTWSRLPKSTRKTNLGLLKREILGFSRMSEILPVIDRASRGGGGSTAGKIAKGAAVIGAAGLGGLMLGLRYDPQKKVGPLKVNIGESMEETTIDEFVQHLEKIPMVEQVIDVSTRDDHVMAVVLGTDGRKYAMALTVADEES